MVLPDELVLERFRSFAVRAVLPLRPITLVYGANNSGKSALLRALALLGASLDPGVHGAVRLPERAFPDVKFLDLAWKGDVGSYAWRLGLRWSEAPVREMLATVNGASDTAPFIRDLEVLGRDGGRLQARANDEHILEASDSKTPLPFEGLMPAESSAAMLGELRTQLEALRGRVSWLSGVRAPAPRLAQSAASSDEPRFSDGTGAASLLAQDGALREEVASYYASLDLPRSLEVHEAPPLGQYLTLNPSGQPRWRVHINDTGEGMTQVLPVLVQASLAAREGGILAIEEPESHLHPSAQRALAEHLCELASRGTEPRFVLETHSRVFLLAVQIAVANGFPSDKVAVVWVDQEESGRSATTVIPIRQNGRLGDG